MMNLYLKRRTNLKAKKGIIQIGFILMLISFVILTKVQLNFPVFKYEFNVFTYINENKSIKDYIITISGGVFTGSFVTVFMSIKEYLVEKKKILEDYFIATENNLNNYRKLEYLNFEFPVNVITGCINEEYCKLNKRPFEKKLKELICDINEKAISEKRTMNEKENYIDKEYRKIIDKYYKKAQEIAEIYMDIPDKDMECVMNIYAEIDFLFHNRDTVYSIYKKQNDIYCMVNREFKIFKNNNVFLTEYRKVIIILNSIFEIQSKLFEIKYEQNGFIVYNNFLYDMESEVSELYKLIYGNKYKFKEPNKEVVYTSFY